MSDHPRTDRRSLLRTTGALAVAASWAPASTFARPAPRNLYARLLTQWTQALVALQVRRPSTPTIAGGIACPLCARLHGRAIDAVYPLLAQARRSNDARMVDAAVRLMRWGDAAASRPDGSFVNEPVGAEWRGTTVFASIAIAEALHHHGALLDGRERARWRERLRWAIAFLESFFDGTRETNVNYPLSMPAALTLAGRALGDDSMVARARARARDLASWFTPNARFIFGEAQPVRGRSPRGRYPVDLLYNVEETLPNLVLYGRAAGDDEVLGIVTESLRTHVRFMLPDGAWDGGWGARSYKWTYWGSRTTDGCQTALGLLGDRDPVFAEAARRNAELLASCTHDGLLHGGLHLREHGEPPCVHHTFCRAKAMAWLVDAKAVEPATRVALPRERASGVERFPEIGTDLAGHGPWRATVTSNDVRYGGPGGHPSGGALSLLWHERLGPIFAASLSQYDTTREPANMPPHRGKDRAPVLTPRLEGGGLASIHDEAAEVVWSTTDGGVHAAVSGRLCDLADVTSRRGPRFGLTYRLAGETFVIEAQLHDDAPGPIALILPVIASSRQDARAADANTFVVQAPGGRLRIESDVSVQAGEPGSRIFQHVPGFQAVALSFAVVRGRSTGVRLRVVA